MNILHVTPTLAPSSGGPPRVAARIASAQAGLGHTVTLLTGGDGGEAQELKEMVEHFVGFERVRVVTTDGLGGSPLVAATPVGGRVDELVAPADVVHLHGIWTQLVWGAGRAARRHQTPYVIQPNDELNPWSLNHKRLKKQVALRLGFRRLIEGADRLLMGHEEELRLAGQAGFKVAMTAGPIGGLLRSETQDLPQPGGFYARHPELGGDPFAVFLGRLHFKKGLDYLAESFAVTARKVPTARLVVVGSDDGARADFERRVGKLGIADRVHLVGPLHGLSKWEALVDGRCFVLPSRDETFTIAVIEALATGLPVVVSENTHLDEIAEYEAGFLVPLEPAAVGEAMARLLEDESLTQRMGDGANKLFDREFCLDNTIETVLDLYREILSP